MGGATSVRICAHRGASADAPENTLAALRRALDQGAQMIEVDVQRTVDGHLVLFHDETLERTSGGRGRLTDFTLAELQELDAGSWFGPEFRGQRIPSLTGVLDLVKGTVPLNLELKGGPQDLRPADALANLLASVAVPPGTIVTSFARELIDHFQVRRPGLPTGLIIEEAGWRDRDLTAPHEILSVPHHLLDEPFMGRARSAGKRVHAWVVDAEEEVRRVVDLGVDVVITSCPGRVAVWLGGGTA